MTSPADRVDATPAELLTAWREAERRRAVSGADGAALTATMRGLMDRYDWAIGGRVGPSPGQAADSGPTAPGVPASGRIVAELSVT